LVRAVHRCRLTEFKIGQRLFKAGDLSISGGFNSLHSRELREREKERKGARREEEGRGRVGNRRIKLFSTPDLRSSSIMPLSIFLFVYLDRSMTCE
jgi:hypothetical protein